ncbi:MAG: thymidylate kinase [Planctomycetota bacterium]|jgi:dTMP kinase|nr:thymidylate kinase [Planctomycetota bacterium]
MSTSKPTSKPYPGALIVAEGIDGSGKSTQLYLLKRWLEISGFRVHFTEWNSSPLVRSATKRGKKKQLLTPSTFSLIHAADFADRWERQILPLLEAGYLVLADRYVYTAYARDGARGCSAEWLRNLYRFAVKPDITLFYRSPLEISLSRILQNRTRLKFHEAGMDLGLSLDPRESFRLFQGMILEQYDSMAEPEGFEVLDGTQSVHDLQIRTRSLIRKRIDLECYRHEDRGGVGHN